MNYGRGWYWGKINSKSYVMVWAIIVKSSKKLEKLAIVNRDNNGYLNINSKNIHFKAEKFDRLNYKKIPTCFTLKIDDFVDNKHVNVDIKMESQNFHFGKQSIANYYRYHVKSLGSIKVDSKKETVNQSQIMEYLTFI
jgi:hypothetical protein